jgi:hypothetical protein
VLLGNGVVFKYILRAPNDRAVRYLDGGVIERDGLQGLRVRDESGAVLQELSGAQIRSWKIVGPNGAAIDSDIVPEDLERLR